MANRASIERETSKGALSVSPRSSTESQRWVSRSEDEERRLRDLSAGTRASSLHPEAHSGRNLLADQLFGEFLL